MRLVCSSSALFICVFYAYCQFLASSYSVLHQSVHILSTSSALQLLCSSLAQILNSSCTAPLQLLHSSSTAPPQVLYSSRTAPGQLLNNSLTAPPQFPPQLLHSSATAPPQLLYNTFTYPLLLHSSSTTLLQLLCSSSTDPWQHLFRSSTVQGGSFCISRQLLHISSTAFLHLPQLLFIDPLHRSFTAPEQVLCSHLLSNRSLGENHNAACRAGRECLLC